jgi:hypothetical protein
LGGEVGRQDAEFAHAKNSLTIVGRFLGLFENDHAVADVYAALGADLEVSLCDIAQIGVFGKLSAFLGGEWP